MPDAFLDHDLEDEMAARWHDLPSGEDIALIAEDDRKLTSFALVRLAPTDGPILESLHVAYDAHGRGIGRSLMAHVARDLLQRGESTMSLIVFTGNAQARAVYKHLGGRESEPFIDIVAGQTVQAVRVTWDRLEGLAAL